MVRVLAVLTHVKPTTFSYELCEALAAIDGIEVTIVSYYDAAVEETAMAPDSAVEFVPLNASSRLDPTAIAHLRWVLRTRSYDVLHTHHNFVGSLARLLAPRGTKIVDTEHADHERHYSLPQVLVNAATLPRADRVVANSRRTLKSLYWFERLGLDDEQCSVIYNGIDVDRIDRVLERPCDSRGTDGRQITTVGRLSETKNQSTVLRAFASLADEHPESRLTIVGDGPLREELESLADSLGVRARVEFTGFVDREEVYRILVASDLYVQPSLSEGFCVALVEAMACRLPVVVSDVPVLHEVVGEAGSYATPTEPAAFADRLRRLLGDDELRREFAERASDRARTEFPLKRTADAYAELYRELLESS
ncbi:glycosyltransferase family 4 protein [Natronococcus sp. A-GB1]|uniref:glycosyltransferase family 4 protein n=1 Tax=Natronococcus sp. A-GB1 TaxID=3037648 RepID=UPI00241F034D|nr:glycosyltransferase family 4 protein [Natronococcus sp. A-GB1]MDG5759866.1 glycosyltransferase family 4 protein [Natronococcus sp. A-GB1]